MKNKQNEQRIEPHQVLILFWPDIYQNALGKLSNSTKWTICGLCSFHPKQQLCILCILCKILSIVNFLFLQMLSNWRHLALQTKTGTICRLLWLLIIYHIFPLDLKWLSSKILMAKTTYYHKRIAKPPETIWDGSYWYRV